MLVYGCIHCRQVFTTVCWSMGVSIAGRCSRQYAGLWEGQFLLSGGNGLDRLPSSTPPGMIGQTSFVHPSWDDWTDFLRPPPGMIGQTSFVHPSLDDWTDFLRPPLLGWLDRLPSSTPPGMVGQTSFVHPSWDDWTDFLRPPLLG
ncbi:hypothetical protein ACOMHN_063621 [Nucella lapillus]